MDLDDIINRHQDRGTTQEAQEAQGAQDEAGHAVMPGAPAENLAQDPEWQKAFDGPTQFIPTGVPRMSAVHRVVQQLRELREQVTMPSEGSTRNPEIPTQGMGDFALKYGGPVKIHAESYEPGGYSEFEKAYADLCACLTLPEGTIIAKYDPEPEDVPITFTVTRADGAQATYMAQEVELAPDGETLTMRCVRVSLGALRLPLDADDPIITIKPLSMDVEEDKEKVLAQLDAAYQLPASLVRSELRGEIDQSNRVATERYRVNQERGDSDISHREHDLQPV